MPLLTIDFPANTKMLFYNIFKVTNFSILPSDLIISRIFDFSNDNKVDYISKTFRGDAHGSTPMEFIYELYSMDTNGHFKEQKDNGGLTYQINHTTFPNDTTKTDKLTEHWITKIK